MPDFTRARLFTCVQTHINLIGNYLVNIIFQTAPFEVVKDKLYIWFHGLEWVTLLQNIKTCRTDASPWVCLEGWSQTWQPGQQQGSSLSEAFLQERYWMFFGFLQEDSTRRKPGFRARDWLLTQQLVGTETKCSVRVSFNTCQSLFTEFLEFF